MTTTKYGVNTVVGGFGEEMTAEQALPYAIARTYYEHQSLRDLLTMATGECKKSVFMNALDVGCGYGRNIPVLREFSAEVAGIERDEELFLIAHKLNPRALILPGLLKDFLGFRDGSFDLMLTFTFLQHLEQYELDECCKAIRRVAAPTSALILAEETDTGISDATTTGRSVDYYKNLFPEFSLVFKMPRKIEPTFPKPDSGTYMLFTKVK